MQHFVLPVLVNGLLVALTIYSILLANPTLIVLSSVTMVAAWIKTALVVWAGLHTVAIESPA